MGHSGLSRCKVSPYPTLAPSPSLKWDTVLSDKIPIEYTFRQFLEGCQQSFWAVVDHPVQAILFIPPLIPAGIRRIPGIPAGIRRIRRN
jgi:hypothetical protein